MSFPKKKFFQALFLLVIIGVIFFATLSISVYYSLQNIFEYSVIGSFLLGFLYCPLNEKLVDWLFSFSSPKIEKLVKDAKGAKRGFEGEDLVSSWLEDIVGKNNFLKNVKLPFHIFDFDAVIIGDKGIIVLEVKNLSSPVYFENGQYHSEKDGKFSPLSDDQNPQIKLNERAIVLRKYLVANGFGGIAIYKALVYVNGLVSWKGDVLTYVIKDKNSLVRYLDGLEVDSRCTPEIQKNIKKLLS